MTLPNHFFAFHGAALQNRLPIGRKMRIPAFMMCTMSVMPLVTLCRGLLLVLLGSAAGHFAAEAQVESLSVNFYWGNSPDSRIQSEPGDGIAGVVAVDAWVELSENELLAAALVASRSGATLADLTVSGWMSDPEPKTHEAAMPSGDNEQLMHRGLRSGSSGNSMTIDITGLDQNFLTHGFDLIAYVVNTENSQYAGTYSLEVDGIRHYGVVSSGFADPSDLGSGFQNAGQSDGLGGAGPVNYLKFENLSGRENLEFTLRNETGARVIMQGFQLIAVPEPGPYAFVLLSAVVACLWRGKRSGQP